MTYGYTSSLTCNATLPGPSLAEMCGASAFVVFMSLLDELIRSNDKISGRCERVESIETPDEEYDFVVIGGGGAGAVIAARLSENPNWKILLLEAGHDEPAGGAIPLFVESLSDTELDWKYTTTNESYACLSTNGSCAFSSGKMLGGSTGLNAMAYLRGNPADYNNWADLGNEGWAWEDVKPFYLLGEDNGEIERVGRFYHGTGGPLSVERFPYLHPFGHSILAANVELGYGVSEDLNGEQITGCSITQSTNKNGVRRSSAAAYLRPVRNRKNLHISLNSLATRIIIGDGKAVGVEYFQKEELKTVHISREVVVSAGVIKSPHLLLLSGIGPKEHLKSMGVNVVKDLRGVGENFHDHVSYNLKFTINEVDKYENDWTAATEYFLNQTGPMSGLGLGPMFTVLRSKSASSDSPNIQLHFIGYTSGCAPGGVALLRNNTGQPTIFLRVVNVDTKSRGRISLASNDSFEYPVIWGNYLSDPRDVDVLIEAIELGLALANTEALRAHNFTLSTTPVEACANFTFPSSEYWACAIRRDPTIVELHQAGSCKMGPSSDPMAVVDHRLRVHGIEGLRVADNSIMPRVISANTAAPAMMIGERAADFIKKDWRQDSVKITSTHRIHQNAIW